MKHFGVNAISNNYKQYIIKHSSYKLIEYNIEGDWSSASYFCFIDALHSDSLEISNSNLNSVQGDKNFINLIEKVGADVEYKKDSIIIRKNKLNQLEEINMELMPDYC